MHRTLRTVPFAIAAAGLLMPAAAQAATSKSAYPVVKTVAPLKVQVGGKLTIKGTHFRAGVRKTTVVFQRTGKPAVFVKASKATTTKLTVTVPAKIGALLVQRSGAPTATKFKLRVLTTRFARTWTSSKTSPTISPKAGQTTTPSGFGTTGGKGDDPLTIPPSPSAEGETSTPAPTPSAYELCMTSAIADGAADNDADGLTNATELGLKFPTDPCNPDTDGDEITDGYEYYSAKDLNGTAVPYPGNKPWPNALDPIDVNDDFDGDGLTLFQEFHLWKLTDGHYPLHSYSDGTQNTGGPQPVTPQTAGYDIDGDGNLTDDERDADGDGLSNQVELNFTGTQEWWNAKKWYRPNPPASAPSPPKEDYVEAPYTYRHFSNLDAGVADSDGDGILDGADDQDNDGVSNFVEMQLGRAGTGLRVQPFNPCLPNPYSPTCGRYVPMDDSNVWPPFDDTEIVGDAYPFGWDSASTDPAVLWDPSMAAQIPQVFFGPWDGHSGPQGP